MPSLWNKVIWKKKHYFGFINQTLSTQFQLTQHKHSLYQIQYNLCLLFYISLTQDFRHKNKIYFSIIAIKISRFLSWGQPLAFCLFIKCCFIFFQCSSFIFVESNSKTEIFIRAVVFQLPMFSMSRPDRVRNNDKLTSVSKMSEWICSSVVQFKVSLSQFHFHSFTFTYTVYAVKRARKKLWRHLITPKCHNVDHFQYAIKFSQRMVSGISRNGEVDYLRIF